MFCCSRYQTRERWEETFLCLMKATNLRQLWRTKERNLNNGDLIARQCCCKSFISHTLKLSNESCLCGHGVDRLCSDVRSSSPTWTPFEVTAPKISGSRCRKALTSPAHFTPGTVSPENWMLLLLLFSPTIRDGKSALMWHGTTLTVNECQTFSAEWKMKKMKVDRVEINFVICKGTTQTQHNTRTSVFANWCSG